MKFVGATWWEDPPIWWFPNPSNWHLPKDPHPKCVVFSNPHETSHKVHKVRPFGRFSHNPGQETYDHRGLLNDLRPTTGMTRGILAEVVSLRCWFEWFHFSEGLGVKTWLGLGRSVWHPWFFGGKGIFFWGGYSGKIFFWKKEGIDQNNVDNCLVMVQWWFYLFCTVYHENCGHELIWLINVSLSLLFFI